MLRIDPPPFAVILGANARTTDEVPKKWVSISSRMASRSPLSRFAPVDDPALLIRRVTSPAASAAAGTDVDGGAAGKEFGGEVAAEAAVCAGDQGGCCGEVHGESPGWVWHFRCV